MNKFGARKTVVDGHTFDSRAEAARYAQLRLLEQAGQISGLHIHPRFVIHDDFFCKQLNQNITRIVYEGDFFYYENGEQVVEDVKGVQTEAFKIKRKLFLKRYPHIIFRIMKA